MTLFRDRDDAGRQLGRALAERGLGAPIVLGIPRGGVPVAAWVARELDGHLGVVVARKLRAPGQPELAIGAVTADGVAWVNEDVVAMAGAGEAYLTREIAYQAAAAQRYEQVFDGARRPPVRGRAVIIVDDGVATGATALAAARSMRAAGAYPVVIAVPVGPPATLSRLREEADDVVCLRCEEDFWGVGQFYDDFDQIDDSEVREILDRFRRRVETGEPRIRRGGVTLAGRLRIPEEAAGVVVFVHGLGSSKDSPRNVIIAERLVDQGFATLLFDLNGHGESSGADEEGVAGYVEDTVSVCAWVTEHPVLGVLPLALAGSSLGALIALRVAASGRVEPAALVLRAPAAEPAELAAASVPTLVVIGSEDSLIEGAREGKRRNPQVELRIIPGAGHLFDEPGTLELATEATVSWLAGRLGTRRREDEPGERR